MRKVRQTPPAISWDRTQATAVVTAPGMKDAIVFAASPSGKTEVSIRRVTATAAATEVIRVNRPILTLADAQTAPPSANHPP